MKVLPLKLFALGFCWLGLSVPAFIMARPDSGSAISTNYTLAVFLLIMALMWFTTASLVVHRSGRLQLGRFGVGASLLLFGGFTLILELTLRLLASSSFGGYPLAFDFGLKCGASANVSTCERNAAFTPTFNSFGHCVQGGLSMLLLPAIERSASFHGSLPAGPLLVNLMSSLVAGYPIYNLIKRAYQGASSFAASSFVNNSAEYLLTLTLTLALALTLGTPLALT
jgi:hypothetical protein